MNIGWYGTSYDTYPFADLLAHSTLKSNLSRAALLTRAVDAGEGQFNAAGAFCAQTGIHTGRSPKDRFIVRDEVTEHTIDWGAVNQPLSPTHFASLKQWVLALMTYLRAPLGPKLWTSSVRRWRVNYWWARPADVL